MAKEYEGKVQAFQAEEKAWLPPYEIPNERDVDLEEEFRSSSNKLKKRLLRKSKRC